MRKRYDSSPTCITTVAPVGHDGTVTGMSCLILYLQTLLSPRMAVLMCTPKIIALVLAISLANPQIWTVAVLVNAVGILFFALRIVSERRRLGVWWPRGRFNLASHKVDAKLTN
jgi:hypothetical protein